MVIPLPSRNKFDAISYLIAVRCLLAPLFLVKGANFKRGHLEQAISNGLGFYVSEKIMKLVSLPFLSMLFVMCVISSKP